MKVLVACEFSGVVRDAFIERGHDAISCDLLPTERPGPHIQGDVRPLLQKSWDLVIAHPPCTYLCNSGVRWLHERPERWIEMWKASRLFLDCLLANAPKVAVENPVMHGHAQVYIGRPSFTVQPWQFGVPEKKRTCFWVRGVPVLEATEIVEPTLETCFRMPPGPDRGKERSRFHPGMAAAIAQQWG